MSAPRAAGRNEAVFGLFAGLKGAVPILLGSLILDADVPDAPRVYGIVIVVVAFSVLVQGSLVPTVASALGLPMHTVQPQPCALGVRLAEEPTGALRLRVQPGSFAAGRTTDTVPNAATAPESSDEVQVNMLVRNNALLAVRPYTQLQAGDELLLTADQCRPAPLHALFTAAISRPADDDRGPQAAGADGTTS
jgi:cell volume regulation protein A